MSAHDDLEEQLRRAADAIRAADALAITAGAGMGVDSGLPDFRGSAGFWRAYPQFARLNLRFTDLANPQQFARDPHLAWGFYGHRLNLYRAATPHAGFARLLRWSAGKPGGTFVFTSNVDGHFQRAGFADDRVAECHGSIHHLQCAEPCCGAIWDARDVMVDVTDATMRAADPLPTCPHCGGVARPNVLLFGDGRWLPDRTDAQLERWYAWRKSLGDDGRLAVIECGAGMAIPTVRYESEYAAGGAGAALIRINPREADAPPGHVSLPMPAAAALEAIDALGVV